MTHAPHALTHMNNYRITRTPLPALLPTILAGLFILAGCGGSALPIPVIATESTDVANNLESNAPDSILLSVGEQPPEVAAKSAPPANTPPNTPAVNPIVQKQVQVKKQAPAPIVPTPVVPKQVQKQIPAPVFEVAVAPARPPQRSFSTAPQVSTDFVPRSDATGESGATGESSHAGHNDGAIKFDDWTASFTTAPPTTARVTTSTATTTDADDIIAYISGYRTATPSGLLKKKTNNVLTYTNAVVKTVATAENLEGEEMHADGDPIVFTRDEYGQFIFTQSERKYIVDNAAISTTKASGTGNQFLSGGAGGLDETTYRTSDEGKFLNSEGNFLNGDGVFVEGDPELVKTPGRVLNRGGLNLATATYNGVALGGDYTDGVAFFRGFEAGTYNYAGLYSGTNLGAPVNTTDPEASWNGRIRTIGYYDFDTDFTLIVKFSTRKLEVTKFTNPKNANQTFEIGENDASYDANGVITGIVRFKRVDNDVPTNIGVLTGLIGADGAVGAFLSTGMSNEGGGNTLAVAGDKNGLTDGVGTHGYAGGFVARPATPPNVVDASDLTGYATIPTTFAGVTGDPNKPRSGFLRIADGASLDTAGITVSPPLNPLDHDPQTFTARRNALIASSKKSIGDGYTFVSGIDTGNENKGIAYVAMLPTTDLGKARPVGSNQPTNASWTGAYSLTSSSGLRALLAPITFTINFETGNLTGRANESLDDGETISILANFGANGVMSGSFGTTSGSIQTSNTSVIGLIGEEGLVGIMQGQNTNGSNVFAGGFTASPPSE